MPTIHPPIPVSLSLLMRPLFVASTRPQHTSEPVLSVVPWAQLIRVVTREFGHLSGGLSKQRRRSPGSLREDGIKVIHEVY